MNVITENVLDVAFDAAEQMAEKAMDYLVKQGDKIANKVKEEYLPLLDALVKNITGEIKGFAFGKEVEVLDMQTLVTVAKQYVTANSNEVAAIRVKQDDGYFIYLAYSKDHQLLPIASNKYVIIKANTLADDVEELFKESELIILK